MTIGRSRGPPRTILWLDRGLSIKTRSQKPLPKHLPISELQLPRTAPTQNEAGASPSPLRHPPPPCLALNPLSAPAAPVRAGRSLPRAERASTTLKRVDLGVPRTPPRLAGRVRAPVFLCMLAYHVVWHTRRVLAPILFDHHDRQAAEATRLSPV